MGCDIHLFVERKTACGWEALEPPANWSASHLEQASEPVAGYDAGKWFWDRNYVLFAWLAGVRNYHAQKPLAPPRGLPVDVSAFVKSESDDWGGDGHSHTWFTVAELMSGLEGMHTKHGGAVNVVDYAEWKASGSPFPREWCKSSGAPNISEADFAAGKRPEVKGPLAWAGFTIECEWTVSGRVAFQRLTKLISHLVNLGSPDAVRLVMWFDN